MYGPANTGSPMVRLLFLPKWLSGIRPGVAASCGVGWRAGQEAGKVTVYGPDDYPLRVAFGREIESSLPWFVAV